mgnify:CR=1 FL=1
MVVATEDDWIDLCPLCHLRPDAVDSPVPWDRVTQFHLGVIIDASNVAEYR